MSDPGQADYSRTIPQDSIDDAEKDKMLRGEIYNHDDRTLADERRRCKLARLSFNNASNPIHGIHLKERARLLKEGSTAEASVWVTFVSQERTYW